MTLSACVLLLFAGFQNVGGRNEEGGKLPFAQDGRWQPFVAGIQTFDAAGITGGVFAPSSSAA